jgi:hypothetical protein
VMAVYPNYPWEPHRFIPSSPSHDQAALKEVESQLGISDVCAYCFFFFKSLLMILCNF